MPFRSLRLIAGVFAAVFVLSGPVRGDAPAGAELSDRLRALVEAPATGDSAEANALRRFYEERAYAPAWIGNPERIAALTAILAGSADHGLGFAVPKSVLARDADAASEIALSRLALGYASALAMGRVQPEQIESDWAIPAPGFDAAAGLKTALERDLAAWFAGLAPDHPDYQRLMAALVRYRAIAERGGWPVIGRGEPLKQGVVDERVRALRRRLAAEGDLAPALAPAAPDAAAASPIQPVAATAAPEADEDATFDGDVEQAVRSFQKRYGIGVDGAVGPRTLAAMSVSARARVQQIELNLERWRSLPHQFGARYMMVNVPAETLEIVNDGEPVMTMKVVVGDADHPTPVVTATMTAVTLNPTWTIPNSIYTKEIGPKSKSDHGYLLKNDIVFTPGRGWQQMPGPKNPLGQIKFETPNRFDVYLHDTPSRVAFDRFFRAQSHGCVRLERAAELAGFVLQGAGWDGMQIAQAVATGENRRIELKRRWRVYFLYATSFADEDGTVEFRDDLYGRDTRLRAALAAAAKVEQPRGDRGSL